MLTFTVLFYILETIFYSITLAPESRVFFLYQKGLKKHNESSVEKVKDLTLDKMVIYISKTRFVGLLTLKNSHEPVNGTTQVSSYYKNESNCPFRGYTEQNHSIFGCQQISRIITIKTIIGFSGMGIVGYDTFIENYIGCFTAMKAMPFTQLNYLEECESSCTNTRYFGMKSRDQCFCIKDLDLFSTELIQQCTMSCRSRRFQICGGKEYISLYIKDDFLKTKTYYFPSWECAYNQTNCTICPAGRIGLNCELIDCQSNNGGCKDQICQNFLWNDEVVALCSCQKGFYLDKYDTCRDIDECSIRHICDLTTATCINNDGSYKCMCQTGYRQLLSTEERFLCADINECENEKACQHDNFTYCVNLLGSFKCNCRNGFRRGERNACEDIDECSTRHICDLKTAICVNNDGSYRCMCHTGYRQLLSTEETFLCADIDECENEKACQHDNFTYCVNLLGSFKCNCRSGFRRGERNACEDIDECSIRHICDLKTAMCVNNDGSYRCMCHTGYRQLLSTEETFLCADTDECENERSCQHDNFTYCINLLGSFKCSCRYGFRRGERYVCEDINECFELLHNCGRMATCIDKLGSYECICPPGMLRISYLYLVECQDKDECFEANACNKTSSICLNILGSYVCQCLTGYSNVDSHTCEKNPIVQTNKTPEIELFTWSTEMSTLNSIRDLDTLLMLLVGVAGALTFLSICICFICYYRRKQRTNSGTMSTITGQSGIMKL